MKYRSIAKKNVFKTYDSVYLNLIGKYSSKYINFFRLFILYCRTKNIEKDHVFFSYGGRPIRDTDTPKSLGLKDGDVIQLKYRLTIKINLK